MGRRYENKKIITEKKEKENMQADVLNSKLAMAELVEQMEEEKINNQLAMAELIESIEGGTAV
ncbi:hypothetical protein Q5O14_07930 [Eubacteriaceae bacterium ES2]|nr:hypothetical protein Q5O14_07930 [Eubacteriaceae bacterium ES2]